MSSSSDRSTLKSKSCMSMDEQSTLTSATPTSTYDMESYHSTLEPSLSSTFTGYQKLDHKPSEAALQRNMKIELHRKNKKTQQRRLTNSRMFYGDIEDDDESQISHPSTPVAKRLRRSKSVGSKRSRTSHKSARSKNTRASKSEASVKNTRVVGVIQKTPRKSQMKGNKSHTSVEKKRQSRKI